MKINDKPKWENASSVIDPQISAGGEHLHPFELS